MRVVLLRHPAVAIRSGLCYGRLDVPLRPDALAALPETAARISSHQIARVWTSPASRCRLPATMLATVASVPLEVDARLRELDFGSWEGMAWDSVPRVALDPWAADPLGFAPPRGEAGWMLLRRVREVHHAIRQAGENCAVVSHGGPLRILAALLSGAEPDLLAAPPALGSVVVLTC
jgi:alpha-ribazole phosphatase